MAEFVMVHGGWVGGWFYQRLAKVLREAGHEAWTPTLTGLGDRRHLATPAVDLETHVTDIVSLLECEDLRDVILVGHSAGGMVATAVAERVPERLAQVIYLDAFLPEDGETLAELVGPELAAHFRGLAAAQGDGWLLPLPFPPAAFGITSEEELAWLEPRIAPHPVAVVLQPVRVGNPRAAALPHAYVACTVAPMGLFDLSAARAREKGWIYRELAAPHGAVAVAPGPLAELLIEIAAGVEELQPRDAASPHWALGTGPLP